MTYINAISAFCWAIANMMIMSAAALLGAAMWIAIFVLAYKWCETWVAYSPRMTARRLRVLLRRNFGWRNDW